MIPICLIFLLNIQYAEGYGFGVGPNYIHLDSALRNTTFRQTVYIYNENSVNTTVYFSIAGEPKNWINLYEYNEECCPLESTEVRNNSNKPIICKIDIPGNIANKLYEATIYVDFNSSFSDRETGNVSNVKLSLPIEVSLNVTGDQDYNVSIRSLYIKDSEVNLPLEIRAQYENKGNVIAQPTIEILITKDDAYIDRIVSRAKPIKPLNLYNHHFEWDTVGKPAGFYNAKINIFEGNTLIQNSNLSFKLLPPGSIERNATFNGITYEGNLVKGKIIKLIASFTNTGKIDLDAQFFGEIYRDGNLIGTVTSPVSKIAKYKDHGFISYLTLDKNGEYLVKGHILYGGIPTETKELTFSVGASLGLSQIILLIIFVSLGVIFVLFYSLIKKNNLSKKLRWKSPKPSSSSVKEFKTSFKPKKVTYFNKKKKIKVNVKGNQKKSKPLNIEKMTVREIEEYVKNL
jgi:hypothetical protein